MCLAAQLRESAPYLKDIGWEDTAKLVLLAADEIEGLRKRIPACDTEIRPMLVVPASGGSAP
jgi:hypothetical protein